MFIGSFDHTIDAKGRVNMPSKLRDGLGESFYMTTGHNNCIFVFSSEGFMHYYEKLGEIPINDAMGSAFARRFLGNATECLFDKQGRIIIPQGLRQHAGLSKDVKIIGVGKRIEIWSLENWLEYESGNGMDFDALAEHMASLGI